MQLRTVEPAGSRPGADHEIQSRELVLVAPETLADDPPQAVALHRRPCGAQRHGEPQAGGPEHIGCGRDAEESITKPPSSGIGGLELGLAPQTALRRESEPPWHCLRFARDRDQERWCGPLPLPAQAAGAIGSCADEPVD